MNPHTGHLVRFEDENALAAAIKGRYEALLSQELQAAAEVELAGKTETYVDLLAKTPLAAWAKQKRKEKIAAASRRANRK